MLQAALLLAGLLAACTAAASPFDPTGPCLEDGSRPGAYPELEARLPDRYEGAAPTSVDSGRNCSEEALGSLAEAGIEEMRFAGASWDLGSGRALTIAVFEAPALDTPTVIDFYEAGARTARRTQALERSDVTVGGRPGSRLDVLYGESAQTIVAWPDEASGLVWVLLAADVGDTKVAEALQTFGGS
jgi:hypothetical protein